MNLRPLAGRALALLSLAVALHAAAPAGVDLTLNVEPAGTALETHIAFEPGPSGARTLAIRFTNTSASDVFLERIRVALPWAEQLPASAQLCSGGACMFRTPALVFSDPAQAVPSGSFLLARDGEHGTFAGILTWRTLWSKLSFDHGRLVVTADGERRRVKPGETLALERIWLARGDDWQDLLFAYADEVARENKIVLKNTTPWVGWSTWDYFGGRFTYEQTIANLDAVVGLKIGANLLQIDGGWWTRCGDYLSPRANLPGGMKQLADEIHRRGLVAGIHLDGMRADGDSRVALDHPEFFLHDGDGQLLTPPPARTGSRPGRVFFDFSHPGARAHMRDAIRTIRREWGYDYFKIDFLRFGFPEDILSSGNFPSTTRVVPHDDSLTSVERFRLAMATFREAMGDDAYFLACSAEFGPTYGFVDAQRTGGDIDPTFSRFRRAVMENGGNFYLHRKVVINDTDYHVARNRHDEDEFLQKDPRKTGGDMPLNEDGMWTHFVGLFGSAKISGDNLTILRDERKALFRAAVALPSCDRFVPIDFWAHARERDDPPAVFLGAAGEHVYLAIFNWSDRPREFALRGLSPVRGAGLERIGGAAELSVHEATCTISLTGHSSVVYRVNDALFDRLRKSLSVE